jgi:hypothetical protein
MNTVSGTAARGAGWTEECAGARDERPSATREASAQSAPPGSEQ